MNLAWTSYNVNDHPLQISLKGDCKTSRDVASYFLLKYPRQRSRWLRLISPSIYLSTGWSRWIICCILYIRVSTLIALAIKTFSIHLITNRRILVTVVHFSFCLHSTFLSYTVIMLGLTCSSVIRILYSCWKILPLNTHPHMMS